MMHLDLDAQSQQHPMKKESDYVLIKSPQKSVRRLSCELEISRQSVHNSSYCACSSHLPYNKII